jgi:hypothetical protein
MNAGLAGALPSARFFSGPALQGSALPIPLANAGTRQLPNVGVLDAAGFNTLSLFVTIANMVAGNTYKIVLSVVDPETGLALAANKGDQTLISQTANNSYATTLYLPTLYAGLTTAVMPFYFLILTLSNTGGNVGTMNTTALKLWLSNA